MVEVRQTEAFAKWLKSLKDERAAAKIAQRIVRLQSGLLGDVKPVGGGVSELRIVILLCGGDKGTQTADIKRAKALAADI
jgi:putative component of toxin-antitoxin plasmid stabilization module